MSESLATLNRDLDALAALGRAGARAGGDPAGLLTEACTLVVESLGFDAAAVYRLLPGGELELVAAFGDGDGPGTVAVAPLLGAEGCLGVVAALVETPDQERLPALDAFANVLAGFLEGALERERLRRLGDLQSHFIALASHELRAPVAVVHGIGLTLKARHDALAFKEVQNLHGILAEQTGHLAQLVAQLLDLSRLDANAIRLDKRSIRVRARIEEIVRAVAGDTGAIEIDVEPELETLVDPGAFDRIVSNLVTNAIRYGGAPIRVAAQQRDTHFRLAVEDHGDGVAREFVPRLFERFTRSDESAPKTGGSGLGLAIAQSYANAHGGELLYEPAEPKGARFELVLPRPHALDDALG